MKTPPHQDITHHHQTPIRLFIHTPNDDIVTLPNLRPDATTYELKSLLELRTGILAELQSIYMCNVKLNDRKTLAEEKLKNGTVLRIKIKEESLQQIYLAACKGQTNDVFRLGVELMKEEELDADESEEDSIDSNTAVSDQLKAWNTFVPLRAFQALFGACYGGHVKLMVRLLEKAAANVNMVSKNRHTALHLSAYHGHLACLGTLLSQGADSKLMDLEGMTALSFAALNNHVKVEKHLWLFNWNMDVLAGREKQQNVSDQQRESMEIRETAKKYKNQYQSIKEQNQQQSKLPTILTDRLNMVTSSATKTIITEENDKIKLPDIQSQRTNKQQRNNINIDAQSTRSSRHQQLPKDSTHSAALAQLHQRRLSKPVSPENSTSAITGINKEFNPKSRHHHKTKSLPTAALVSSVETETPRLVMASPSLPKWCNGVPSHSIRNPKQTSQCNNITIIIKPPTGGFDDNGRPAASEKSSDNRSRLISYSSKTDKERTALKLVESPFLDRSEQMVLDSKSNSSCLPAMGNNGLQQQLGHKPREKKVNFKDVDNVCGEKGDDTIKLKSLSSSRLTTVTVIDSVNLNDVTRVQKQIIPTDRTKLKNMNQANPKRIRIAPSVNETIIRDIDNTKIISSVSDVNAMSYVDNVKNIPIKTTPLSKHEEQDSVKQEDDDNLHRVANDDVNRILTKLMDTDNGKIKSTKVPKDDAVINDDKDVDINPTKADGSGRVVPIIFTGPGADCGVNPSVKSVDRIELKTKTVDDRKPVTILNSGAYTINTKDGTKLIPSILTNGTDGDEQVNNVDSDGQPTILHNGLVAPPSPDCFWQPELSHQVDTVKINGRFTKTFEEWLDEKNQQAISRKSPVAGNSTAGKQQEDWDEENDKLTENERFDKRKKAYEQWLQAKQREFSKQRLLSKSTGNSLSPQLIKRTRTMSSHSCSFNEWLQRKRELVQTRSTTPTPSENNDTNTNRNKNRERIRHGMTFEEWKAWKLNEKQRKLKEIAENYENTFNTLQSEKRKQLNDATYEKWLRRKDEERRINTASRETLQAQQNELEAIRKTRKYNDPHLKTYEEWLLEKDHASKFETKNSEDSNAITRYQEDSNVIFDMWLANKFAAEMSELRGKLTSLNKSGAQRPFGSMESIKKNEYIYSSDSDGFDSDSDEEE